MGGKVYRMNSLATTCLNLTASSISINEVNWWICVYLYARYAEDKPLLSSTTFLLTEIHLWSDICIWLKSTLYRTAFSFQAIFFAPEKHKLDSERKEPLDHSWESYNCGLFGLMPLECFSVFCPFLHQAKASYCLLWVLVEWFPHIRKIIYHCS